MIIPVPVLAKDLRALKDEIQANAQAGPDQYIQQARYLSEPKHAQPILEQMLGPICEIVKRSDLVPETTFSIVYEKGSRLVQHKDRERLDVTITMPLDSISAEYPFIVEGETFIAPLGSGILIRGHEREHWREECPIGPSYWLLLHYYEPNAISVSPSQMPVVIKGFLSDQQIAKIYLSPMEFQKGTTTGDDSNRDSQVAWLRRGLQWNWLYDLIVPPIQQYDPNFVMDESEQEDIQFTKYEAGGFYGLHRDNDFGSNRRKLSATILLNKPKAGGQLEIEGKMYHDLDVGDMVIFPSTMMHQVYPVAGVRESLVVWLSGENQ